MQCSVTLSMRKTAHVLQSRPGNSGFPDNISAKIHPTLHTSIAYKTGISSKSYRLLCSGSELTKVYSLNLKNLTNVSSYSSTGHMIQSNADSRQHNLGRSIPPSRNVSADELAL